MILGHPSFDFQVNSWLHIICSRMQKVNLYARPSIIQVGCPTCCYQVCAPHAKGVLQTGLTPQSPTIVMYFRLWGRECKNAFDLFFTIKYCFTTTANLVHICFTDIMLWCQTFKSAQKLQDRFPPIHTEINARLTHWGGDKMTAIFKFVPKGPSNHIPVLDQIMTRRHPGDKLLSEPMLVYMRHSASMSWWVNIEQY